MFIQSACISDVQCVLNARAESGESPVWSVAEQCLYWVDQQKPTLNRFNPARGSNDSWVMPADISSFALREGGKPILVALRTGLYDFHPSSGNLIQRADAPYDTEIMRFNDGRCDRQGRYIIGSVDLSFIESGEQGRAALYRFDEQGLSQILQGVTVSNGLAFSPDGHTMYRAESASGDILAYDYDTRSGTLSNERLFARLGRGEGIPDGAEVDEQGGYWIALLLANAVVRFNPDGSFDRRIDVPVLQPTKPCFGGPDLTTLYLTSASYRHLPGTQPLGTEVGSLFAIETGFRGLPEPMLSAA